MKKNLTPYLNINENYLYAVDLASQALNRGELIIFPTETVYGLGAKYNIDVALNQLKLLKERDEKPFQILIADFADLDFFKISISYKLQKVMEEFWPGPLTIVVRQVNNSKTLGLRMPNSPFIRDVIKKIKAPLVATSANKKNMPAPITAKDADNFSVGVNLIIDGGKCKYNIHSTVIEIIDDKIVILREGALSKELFLKYV